MHGYTLVPRGAPDPDGDRRFSERAFPLLEPARWVGERHRGGYGVSSPGSVTNSLGLIFGPWDPFVSEPRLAVTVGDDTLGLPFIEHSAFMLNTFLVASREELLRSTLTTEPPPSFQASLTIEGAAIIFDAYGSPAGRWVGLGQWGKFWVDVHAISVPPDHIELRVTDRIH